MKENIGLHHVALAIQDRSVYERTVDFYRHVLEFPLVRSWGRAERHITVLNMGNCALEIVYGAEGAGTGVLSHVALAVDDPVRLHAMLERCVNAGCTLTRPEGKMEVVLDDGRPYCFINVFCLGPAGETLEFFCEL